MKKEVMVAALSLMLAVASANATTYNESVSGDLSDNKAAPTPLVLTPGLNRVIGTVAGFPEFGGTDPQDWVSFTIPAGFVMVSYVNEKYTGIDDQGFTGFQSNPFFSGDEFNAASYTGYAHFGPLAQNPDGNPVRVSTVHVNLLPLMTDPTFDPGATGFTAPLGAGTYTFLIQQGDPNLTGYQFNMTLRPAGAVPEPGSSLCLLAIGTFATLALRRRLS
jgi:PEP-CTERM motif